MHCVVESDSSLKYILYILALVRGEERQIVIVLMVGRICSCENGYDAQVGTVLPLLNVWLASLPVHSFEVVKSMRVLQLLAPFYHRHTCHPCSCFSTHMCIRHIFNREQMYRRCLIRWRPCSTTLSSARCFRICSSLTFWISFPIHFCCGAPRFSSRARGQRPFSP